MPERREFDIVLFGVTGFTGGLILQYWLNNPSRFAGKEVAIAGRTYEKLEQLKSKFGQRADGTSVSLIKADVSNRDSIREMVGRARVLINCVGPFCLYGEPVVAECATQGTHYVDITGEGQWVRDMVHKYHETAIRSGAVIVPAAGFDSVPADIISRKAYDMLPPSERAGKHVGVVTSLRTGRADKSKSHGGISHGTYQTLLLSLATGEGLGSTEEKVTHMQRLRNGVRNDDVLRQSLFPFEITSDVYVVRRTQKLLGGDDKVSVFEYRQASQIPNRLVGYIAILFFAVFKLLVKIPFVLRLCWVFRKMYGRRATQKQIKGQKHGIRDL
eukprot:Hpha_TRINITY_DN10526_c0_g1::TRINITY_DN10526_c0_g1_i1::g.31349::m.31349